MNHVEAQRRSVNELRALGTAVALSALSLLAACGDDFGREELEGQSLTADTASDAVAADTNNADAEDVSGGTNPVDASQAPVKCESDAECTNAPACHQGRCLETGSGKFCANVQVADGSACEDDDPCTVVTRCKAGSCENEGESGCGCKEDEDCAKFDDTDY